jgi:hypothetical protein
MLQELAPNASSPWMISRGVGKKATLLFSLISRSREETEEEGGEAGMDRVGVHA